MEEQKKNQEVQEQSAPSIEQLQKAVDSLWKENRNLIKHIQEMEWMNMNKRMDYLFACLKYADAINDADFIQSCVEEIKESLTITPEAEPSNNA